MLDLVGNPNCWFCHAQAHIETWRLDFEAKIKTANQLLCTAQMVFAFNAFHI